MRPALIVFGVILVLGLIAGTVYKLFYAETSKTVIQRGAKQVIINTEGSKQPLFNFGCANVQVEAYWKKQRLLAGFASPKEEKK